MNASPSSELSPETPSERSVEELRESKNNAIDEKQNTDSGVLSQTADDSFVPEQEVTMTSAPKSVPLRRSDRERRKPVRYSDPDQLFLRMGECGDLDFRQMA
jgi:hypothetical protein